MRRTGWAIFLGFGLGCGVAGVFVGEVGRGLLVQAVGWGVVIVTVRRYRTLPPEQRKPWQYFAVAGALLMTSGLARAAHGIVLNEANPFPSPIADALSVAAYLFIILAVHTLARLRSPRAERSALVDGLIVAAGAGVVAWATLLSPYAANNAVPLGERLLNSGFSLLTILLLAATVRLAVGPGARTGAYALLAGSVVLAFTNDIALTVATVRNEPLNISTILPCLVYAFFGAAVLHPSLPQIVVPPDNETKNLTWRRIGLLAVALLVSPAVLIWQLLAGGGPDLPVIAVGSVVLSVLVLARLTGLVRAKERTAWREHILGEANAGLVSSTTRREMDAATLRGVTSLCKSATQFRASVASAEEGWLRVVDSVGHRSRDATGASVALDALPEALRQGLVQRRSVTVTTAVVDLAAEPEPPQRAVLVSPLVSQNELRGALIVTSREPLPLDIRGAIEQLASMVSLAFETAALTEDLHRQRSERRFRVLVEHSSDIVVVLGDDGRIGFVSPAAKHLLGKDGSALLGRHPLSLVHPDDTGLVASMFHQVTEGADDLEPAVLRLGHADGSHRWFEVRARNMTAEPELRGVVINAREISDRKAAEDALLRREARFRALVQHSSDVVMVVDQEGTITYVTPAVQRVLGYEDSELVGRQGQDLLTPEEQAHVRRWTRDAVRSGTGPGRSFGSRSIELRLRHRNGEWRTLDVTANDLRHEPEVEGVVLNARDVTDRKALEHDLRHQALHDSLTGLGNRAMLLQRTDEALAHRSDDLTVSALFIDLDDFKTVNDSLGHGFGDELLVQVAARLTTCLHHNDVAARLGGDEFAVLLQSPYGPEEVTKVADRILFALRSPFTIQDRDVVLSASVGISHEDPSTTSEVLLRNADMAMYLAKERGKDRHEVFQEGMHASVFERLVLKADLAHGIESGQLRLCYQPIVSLETGRITGVESLVRWDHPTRGRLSPGAFVELAEDTGLIIPLGRWVLEEACRQLRTWQLQLPAGASLTMSVNLSVRQLEQDEITDAVAGAIHHNALDPSTITLELTETMLAESEVAQRRLGELRNLGVSLAVDDFGTGYSSLGYVQQFPIDVIKIDRSFVDQLGSEAGGKTVVVQTMIEMAQRLGVHIVAEGIEDREQLRMLQFLGCDLGQGYYFSRPVGPSAIEPLLTASMDDGARFLREPYSLASGNVDDHRH